MSFVQDTFTGVDLTSLLDHAPDVGGTYFIHGSSSGTPAAQIQSNRLAGGFNLYGLYYNNAAPSSANYSISIDLQNTGTLENAVGGGVAARLASAASLTCYMARVRSGSIILQRFLTGSGITLGTVSHTLTNSEDYRLKLDCLESSINVFVQRLSNGNWINSSGTEQAGEVACISATNSDITAANFVGVTGRLTVWSFDNFNSGVPAALEETVSQHVSMSQASSVTAYRVPLTLKSGRITRLPYGERIQGQDPLRFLVTTLSDLDSATYYYYGGVRPSNGDWRINRFLKTNINAKGSATEANNGAYTTLAAAWAARASLVYG